LPEDILQRQVGVDAQQRLDAHRQRGRAVQFLTGEGGKGEGERGRRPESGRAWSFGGSETRLALRARAATILANDENTYHCSSSR
jgi:hypothetical protein